MTEEERKSYEILYEKIMFVDKYRMLKPHWIKFHNYIEKLQKENLLLSAKENMSAYFEFKRNYISKDKIREIIEELENEEKALRKDFEKHRVQLFELYKKVVLIEGYKKLLEEE